MIKPTLPHFSIDLHNELMRAFLGGLIRKYDISFDRVVIELDFDATTNKKLALRNYMVKKYGISIDRIRFNFNKIEIMNDNMTIDELFKGDVDYSNLE